MLRKLFTVTVLALLLLTAGFAPRAMAAVEYYYTQVLGDGPAPGDNSGAWLIAKLEDYLGDVKMTLAANNLLDGAKIGSWAFDFVPDVSFSCIQDPGSTSALVKNIDYSKAVLGHHCDLVINFVTNPAGAFIDNEQMVFWLKGPGLTASMFGDDFTAAHIQSISCIQKGDDSCWVTATPEPIGAGLFLLGGGALAFIRRKNRTA